MKKYRERVSPWYLSYFVWTLCKLKIVNSSFWLVEIIESWTNSIASSDHTNKSMLETYDGWSIYNSLLFYKTFDHLSKFKLVQASRLVLDKYCFSLLYFFNNIKQFIHFILAYNVYIFSLNVFLLEAKFISVYTLF